MSLRIYEFNKKVKNSLAKIYTSSSWEWHAYLEKVILMLL